MILLLIKHIPTGQAFATFLGLVTHKKIGRRPKVVDFVCMKIKGDPLDFSEVSFGRRFSVSLVFLPLNFLDWLPVKQKVTLRVGLFAEFPGQHLRRTLSSVFDS